MLAWILSKLGVVLSPEWEDDIEFTAADRDNVG